METRSILHSDMNCFYASVEMMLDPSLRNKAVAVCGSTEDRHGIVLAKSELAKRAGVKTGMVNWEAKQRCPNLILVPPQYEQYLKFSALARAIYGRFTDLIEPFGMDECWLDVTASRGMCGSGMDIAESIRQTVKDELGLTVSIGVSFNKIYAKLGSDMKKPVLYTNEPTTEPTKLPSINPKAGSSTKIPWTMLPVIREQEETNISCTSVFAASIRLCLPPATAKELFIASNAITVIVPMTGGLTALRESPKSPAVQAVVRAAATLPRTKPSAPPDNAANPIF